MAKYRGYQLVDSWPWSKTRASHGKKEIFQLWNSANIQEDPEKMKESEKDKGGRERETHRFVKYG